MSRLNFCTLFDSNYLSRGLVMYDSLQKHCSDFHLYVFAFNNKAYQVLQKLNLANLTVIALSDFEDEALLSVKPSRSRAEYCWTSTSSTIRYVFDHYKVENCTYVDADLCFYSNPAVLIAEMEASGKSVLITAHRYTPRYDQSLLRGKYCVQFMYFKNNEHGREVLSWWRERCLEWCYAKVEDGKFGDQKYLDDWTTRFPSVHELQHLGGGVAPWNCQQYSFNVSGDVLTLEEKKTGIRQPLVFFHFHGMKLFEGGGAVFAPRSYILKKPVRELLYLPYQQALLRKGHELKALFPEDDFHATGAPKQFWIEKYLIGHVAWIKRNVLGVIFPPSTS
jgi:hypothetical protein